MESWKIQLSPSEVAPGRRAGARCLRLRPRLALLRYTVLSRTSVSCKTHGGKVSAQHRELPAPPGPPTHPTVLYGHPQQRRPYSTGRPGARSLSGSGLQRGGGRSFPLPAHLQEGEFLPRELRGSLGLRGFFLAALRSLPIRVVPGGLLLALCFWRGPATSLRQQGGSSQAPVLCGARLILVLVPGGL